jgi:hypothetical protein
MALWRLREWRLTLPARLTQLSCVLSSSVGLLKSERTPPLLIFSTSRYLCTKQYRHSWAMADPFLMVSVPDAHPTVDGYTYSPLPNTNSIRILHIEILEGSKTRYHLKSFPIDNAPSFRALSYTWGPATVTLMSKTKLLNYHRNSVQA